MRFYSQQDEDQYILAHVYNGKPPRNGTFIEIGAFDGVRYSNTKVFEDNFGWRGILIEPIPSAYNKLIQSRSKDNTFFNAACHREKGKAEYIGDHPASGLTGTMSDIHRQRWHSKNRKTYEVTTMPMRDMVDPNKYPHVDLFSIDVEGGELEVLYSFDWEVVKVDVVLIELSCGPYDLEEAREFLKNKNFEFLTRLGNNDLWRQEIRK